MMLGLLLFLSGWIFAEEPKLKPEETIARHLASIGTLEARNSRKTSVAEGKATVKFLVAGSGATAGRALLFSQGRKFRLLLEFDNIHQYLGEDIVFDGEKHAVGYTVTDSRSPFGEFLHTYNGIIQEGLLGSVLSTVWPLLDLQARRPKLQSRGLVKVGGQQLQQLDYQLKKGRDVNVSLYFDPETFRHVKTIYTVTIAAALGTNLQDTSVRETYYKIEETFGAFRTVEGLTVPSQWNIRFSIDGRQSVQWEWDMRLDKITSNQPVG
ncbi:MAG: hypothetical protein ACR2L2_17320 [Acidobacteriota bacterium]